MENPGELKRLVLKTSWPMVVSELSESLYSLADIYFVSKLGTASLAGVGVAAYVSWLLFSLTSLLSVSSLVYIAQAYGARELNKARIALGTAVPATVLLTVPVVLPVVLEPHILISMLTGERELEVVSEGASYLRLRALGLPFMAVAMCFDASLRAVGATKYSMITIVAATLLNIALDPIMIYGLLGFPRMGVSGAALATVVSIAFMVPMSLFFLKRVGLLPTLKFDIPVLVRLVRVGTPATVERLIFSLGGSLYIAVVARCGTVAMAAHQVGVRIESLIFLPGFSFSIAASSLVGQRVGANDILGAKKVGYEVVKVALTYMAVLGLAVAVFSRFLTHPFSSDERVAELSSIYLVLAGLSEPGLALAMVVSGVIRGAGNTIVPLAVNALCLYLVRVASSTILVDYVGVVGAWIAMAVDVYVRGLVLFFIFSSYFSKLARRIV